MIKVSTDKGMNVVSIVGNLETICADTVSILNAIYDGIKDRNENIAEEYKKTMKEYLCKLAFGEVDIDELIKDNIKELVDLIKEMEENNND